MMSITGAFSSLGINERKENSADKRIPKNRSTISLPNMVLSERPKFIRDVCDDEVETTEQPVDFSKKYCETKLIHPEKDNTRSCTFNNVVKSYNNSFTMYAETDLDQPTDYSLRYAEDDSDSDRCNKISKTEAPEFVQDTIKTYCTEDTPYETPFNFSTATSMSDLRIDDKAAIVDKLDDLKAVDVAVKEISNNRRGKIKSEFSSGLMSPEKPVKYCEEGTPGYFSRVPSCGSLNSIHVNDPPKQELKEYNSKKELRRVNKFPAEPKAVKFEEVVNYAEETPLMFSRSSSLASLDSIEQHSIHDDRSSVVSDFSRVTSGVISPSELPDSPSQTVPPSPRPRKTLIIFPTVPPKKTEEIIPETAQNVPKSSVFEDVVKKFKVESTPLHFSTATSLSSLIDDEVDSKIPHSNQEACGGDDSVENKAGALNNLDLNNDLSENSEDEDILAACINIGMQSNRYSQPKPDSPSPTTVPPTYKFATLPEIVDLSKPELPVKNSPYVFPVKPPEDLLQKTDVTSDSLRTYCTEGTPALLSHAGSNSDLSVLSHLNEKPISFKDSLENDKHDLLDSTTTARETGHEELCEKEDLDFVDVENCSNTSRRSSFSSLSDDSHESEEALLEECMLAGMPKSNSPCKSVTLVTEESQQVPDLDKVGPDVGEIGSSDEDDVVILEDCIKMGIESNRYIQCKPKSTPVSSEFKTPPNPTIAINGVPKHPLTNSAATFSLNQNSSKTLSPPISNDTVKNYCTEGTPAILSHAGSCSNLSVLSTQSNENGDCNSNFSDEEDDEKLLEECVKYGIAAITQKNQVLIRPPEPPPDDSDSTSSLSDDSFEAEQALQQCIRAGMPKRTRPSQEDSSELTPAEKALLQQCILEGMKKCRAVPKRQPEEDSSELTEAEQALLRHCIISGMPKNRNVSTGRPSGSRESAELTESERLLLQQCIMAGMPKSRNRGGSRQVGRRVKEGEREHTCCIHCPKNKAKQGYVKGKKKYKERGVVQVRESRDVNIVYVTSQILTVKEVVDRTHENWV